MTTAVKRVQDRKLETESDEVKERSKLISKRMASWREKARREEWAWFQTRPIGRL